MIEKSVLVSVYLVFTAYAATSFAKPIYKVDKAIKDADVIIEGEVYNVDMIDANGAQINELKTHATVENKYKIRHHIRIIEYISGNELSQKEFTIERPIPTYFGKEKLAKGLRLFYFLKRDGTPIDGEFIFNLNRRPRILEILKTKSSKK